jgi:tetratricopeptide (TPR) repeat protein
MMKKDAYRGSREKRANFKRNTVKMLLDRLKQFAEDEAIAIVELWMIRFILLGMLLYLGALAQTPSADTLLQAGLHAQSSQEYWRAEAFFQQAAVLAPNDFRPMLDVARLHLLERKDELSASELQAALALQNDNADIWLSLGQLAQMEGHLNEAEQDWLQATRLAPAGAASQAEQQLGLLYESQQRFTQAEAHFARLVPRDALATYHLGALRLERGDLSGARQMFQATLTQNALPALHAPAALFLDAIENWDGTAASWQQVGLAYLQNDLTPLAEAPLRQAVSLAPGDASAQAALAWIALQQGETDQARTTIHQALALDPGNSFANFVLSQVALVDGYYQTASDALDRALLSDPLNPVLWAARAQIAEQLRDPVYALTAYKHAAEYAGGDPQFDLLLVSFYLKHGQGMADALQAAEQATHLAPTNAQAFDLLGQVQEALSDLNDALAAYEQATLLAPTNAAMHFHLGQLQITLGYLRAADLNLRKAAVLDTGGKIAPLAEAALKRLPPLGN